MIQSKLYNELMTRVSIRNFLAQVYMWSETGVSLFCDGNVSVDHSTVGDHKYPYQVDASHYGEMSVCSLHMSI